MSNSEIMSFVGMVDKDMPEEVWKEMCVRRTLREGRELYNWEYNPDPDPGVFRHGVARMSYLTKPQ